MRNCMICGRYLPLGMFRLGYVADSTFDNVPCYDCEKKARVEIHTLKAARELLPQPEDPWEQIIHPPNN